jgi:hypothetical protein
LGKDLVYSKRVAAEDGTNSMAVEFIRTRQFFGLLHTLGVHATSEPHRPLVSHLSLDSTLYNKGLMLKKLENLLKLCEKGNLNIGKQDLPQTALKPGDMAIVNEYSLESFR